MITSNSCYFNRLVVNGGVVMIKLKPSIAQNMAQGFHIPAKPEILSKLHAVINSDNPSLADVAAIVATDVGLSSAILKTINPPFYGMARAISDIDQA